MTGPLRQKHERNDTAQPLRCYKGHVFHQRFGTLTHRLDYRVFALCITLDKAKQAAKDLPFFSFNRFNLFSLHESDHMEKGYETLQIFVEDMLRQGGALHVDEPAPARIDMLAYPRFLGKAFNPLTIFFCYDAKEQPIAILYQVRNTFGQRHHYAIRLSHTEQQQNRWHHSCEKTFHVSPFIDMECDYHFDITLPQDKMRVTIRQTKKGTPLLTASFSGKQSALSGFTLLSLAAQYCQGGWKILSAIHWEALKLWVKGAKFHKSPPLPARPVTPAYEASTPQILPNGDGQ
ncbi:MAG: DUF1365 domain-containing protein [Cohaesibacter sp.]|nr:DUF1365 domain-containing protein [Cohaesibacter sp.]